MEASSPMRHVALVALVILLAIPTGLTASGVTDDCKAAGTTGCTQLPPPGTSTPTKTDTYYLYSASASCAPSFSDSCSGRPLKGAPVGIVGLLYQETNNLPGLQRHGITLSDGTHIDPDTAVLV